MAALRPSTSTLLGRLHGSVGVITKRRHPRAAIHQVSTLFPSTYVPQQQCREHLLQFMAQHPRKSSRLMDWTQKVFEKSAIEGKHMLFHPQLIHRHREAGMTTTEINHAAFESAIGFCKQLTTRTLSEARIDLKELSAVFVGSEVTNGMALDSYTHVIEEANPSIKRSSMVGMGCVGGVVNLSRAFDYLKSHADEVVQTINIDLYSRLWAYSYPNIINELMESADSEHKTMNLLRNALVPAVILGDAAASTVLLGEHHPKFRFATETLGAPIICDSERVNVAGTVQNVCGMIKPYGVVPVLSEDIPEVGLQAIQQAVNNLMERHPEIDIDFYCMHPGGAKVLQRMEEGLDVSRKELRSAWETLRQYGNCASPTVILALEHLLSNYVPTIKKDKVYGVLGGVGPGMMAEVLLLEINQPMVL